MVRKRARLLLCLLMLTGFMLIATACDDGDEDQIEPLEPTTPVFAPAAPDAIPREAIFTIREEGLEPRQVELTAGVPVQVRVTNSSQSDCLFFIGDYLIGLRVPAGQTERMAFTIPQGYDSQSVTTGCTNEPSRQGSAVIEFRGVLPGAGR